MGHALTLAIFNYFLSFLYHLPDNYNIWCAQDFATRRNGKSRPTKFQY